MHPQQPATLYPPRVDVCTIWRTALPITRIAPDGLRERGFRHTHIEQLAQLDLVRFLPRRCSSPLLANKGGALFPLFDHHGVLACVRRHKRAATKRLGAETVRGLVLANRVARRMLAGLCSPSTVVVVEGESDFLTCSLHASPGAAVIGVVKGAWTPELAARIPDGVTVVLRTDHDVEGARYAAEVGRSLQGRCLLLRSKRDNRDQNDLWRAGCLPQDPREGCEPYTPPPPKQRRLPPKPTSLDPISSDLSDERKTSLRLLAERDLQAILAEYPRHEAARRVGNTIGRRIRTGIFEPHHVATWRSNILDRAKTREQRRNSRDAFAAGLRYGQRDPYLPQDRLPTKPRKPREQAVHCGWAGPPSKDGTSSNSRPRPTPSMAPAHPPTPFPHQRLKPAHGEESGGDNEVAREKKRPDPRPRRWPIHIAEAMKQGARASAVHKRYFEVSDLSPAWAARCLFVSGMMGTAKTELLRSIVEECRARGEDVLYISCRRRLCGQVAVRLELEDYLEVANVGRARYLSICLPSITKVDLRASELEFVDDLGRVKRRRFGAVILDESEMVCRDLFGSIIGARSPQVYEHLRALMQCARRVVCADADLGPLTTQLVRSCLGLPEHGSADEFYLHNTYVDPRRRVRFYASPNTLINEMLRALLRGERIAVFTAFASHARMLGKLLSGATIEELGCLGVRTDLVARLRRERPDVCSIVLTADTAGGTAERAFVRDPDAGTMSRDAVVYNTVMGVGISVETPVDRVFAWAGAGQLTSQDVMQGVFRYRQPRDPVIHMYVEAKQFRREMDREALNRQALSLSLMADAALPQLTQKVRGDFLFTAPENEAHYQLYLSVRTREHALSNCLRDAVQGWLDGWGIPWDVQPEDEGVMAEAARKRTKQHSGKAYEIVRGEDVDAVDQAEDKDWDALEVVRRRGAVSLEEKAQLQRARLTRHLGRPPSRGEIEQEFSARLVSKTQWFAYQRAYWASVGEDAFVRDVELLAEQRSVYASRYALVAKVRVYDLILRRAGFDPQQPEAFLTDNPTLRESGFVDWVRGNESLVAAVVTIPEDLERRPAELIRKVLRQLGVEMESERKRGGGQRCARYQIVMESWTRAVAWSRATFERFVGCRSTEEQDPAPTWDPAVASGSLGACSAQDAAASCGASGSEPGRGGSASPVPPSLAARPPHWGPSDNAALSDSPLTPDAPWPWPAGTARPAA